MKHRQTDTASTVMRELSALRSLPRPVYGHVLGLPNRAIGQRHRHPWIQLSYAASGVIEVVADSGRYVAPPLHAVWVPAGVPHAVRSFEGTEIRSLYIAPSALDDAGRACRVLAVAPLLRELIRTFGEFPVEYDESPWGAAQFVMEYDSAKVPTPPKSIAELFKWACDNKGKLTYPAPPDFTGSVFVRHVFYAAAGDYTKLLGPFDGCYVCPHGPDDGCACRKPQPGMVKQALADAGVVPDRAVLIGDIGGDVEAAAAAGVPAVLVPTPQTRRQEIADAPLVAATLGEAVDVLLRGAS